MQSVSDSITTCRVSFSKISVSITKGVTARPAVRLYLCNLLQGPRSPLGRRGQWHSWGENDTTPTRHWTITDEWDERERKVRSARPRWPTYRLQPAELGSSSWPARGSGRSAGSGSGRSWESAGCFPRPSAVPPGLPPDSHWDVKLHIKSMLYFQWQRVNELNKLNAAGALCRTPMQHIKIRQ